MSMLDRYYAKAAEATVDDGSAALWRDRYGWLDRLRGVAILLMVLDHVLAATGNGLLVRLTLTRASLPLFMLCAGFVLAGKRRPSTKRLVQLGIGGVVASAMGSTIPGMASVDVLLVIVLAYLAWWALDAGRSPLLFGIAGVTMGLYAPALALVLGLPRWDGYQPAWVFGLLCLGAAWRASVTHSSGSRKVVEAPALALALPRWLEQIGRNPLALYLGHLAVLAVLV